MTVCVVESYDYRSRRRTQAQEAFDVNDRVFVYGSLKAGKGNNNILGSSDLLASTQTEPTFALGDVGFPYAFPSAVVPEAYKKLLFPVRGEVYKVDTVESFMRLDSLEGYPSHYDRQIVRLENGFDAWMYIQTDWHSASYCNACDLKNGVWQWD